MENNITTSNITTIESYLDWVRSCRTIENEEGLDFYQHFLFFRGQADKDWELTPSVFRNTYNEFDLLKDAYRHAWKYLQDCSTDLEKMIVLQHYGLHTRLLDLTSNPLIALYFACVGEQGKDGKVFCFCASGNENIRIPEIIAKAVAKGINESNDLDSFLKKEYKNFVIKDDENIVNQDDFEKWENQFFKPQFFLSPYNNNRITAQRGAFIIAPLNLLNDEKYPIFNSEQIEGMTGWHYNVAIIESTSKKAILEELALLGVDESTVFPDIEHLLRFLNNAHYKSISIIDATEHIEERTSEPDNDKIEAGDILLEDKKTIKPSQWSSDKKAIGVVFYVDESGDHGWAVNMYEQSISIEMCTSEYYMSKLPFLTQSERINRDGQQNTKIIRNSGDKSAFPAAHRVDFENGWYIPAIDQLMVLIRRKDGVVNKSIKLIDGDPITHSSYWSSTQYDKNRFRCNYGTIPIEDCKSLRSIIDF
ncbi:MAG: FRG domain-containing protein [Bacteroidales bacterium]|nr:FRG domain-containing protein [Bacteroidales bacterium]